MASLSDYIVGGAQGIQGIQGNLGLQGLQGLQGIQGIQGIQGLYGIQGLVGPGTTLTLKTETAAYTLVLADAENTLIRVNIASANNLTIPLNSTAAIPIGSVITVEQMGAGVVTVVGVSGVTINTSARKTWGQNSVIQLYKVGTDTWNITGGSV